MLLTNKRQFFSRQYGKGIGNYYSDIYGSGVFLNSLKNLGKYFFRHGKSFYQLAKPKVAAIAKETFEDLKPKIQESLNNFAVKQIDNVLNKPDKKVEIKNTIKEFGDNLRENVVEVLPKVKEKTKKSLHELMNGGGMRVLKQKPFQLNKRSKNIIQRLLI